MATDIQAIVRNIESCFDFTGKSVIHVGAGGGQFIGYASRARKVLGVDPDPGAVERLKLAVREKGLEDLFSTLRADLLAVSACADVVLFEFCLHEIDDPRAALRHAGTLAPETLIIDPAPGSSWSWYLCEEQKWTWTRLRRTTRGWTAAGTFRRAGSGTTRSPRTTTPAPPRDRSSSERDSLHDAGASSGIMQTGAGLPLS